MENKEMAFALSYARPNIGFEFRGTDLKSVKWDNDETITPTKSELEKALAAYYSDQEAAESKKLADKANALAKLAALGLTDDEAKAVIGGN